MKNNFNLFNYLGIALVFILTISCSPTEDAEFGTPPLTEGINELEFNSDEISTKFNENFQVFDQSGKNSITLNVGSDDEDLLVSVLEVISFEITNLNGDLESAELQNVNDNKESDLGSNPELLGDLSIRVIALNLDEKAVGFKLNVNFDQEKLANRKVLAYSHTIDYDSPSRWMYYGKVDHVTNSNQNSDIQVNWYYRTCSTCSMNFDWQETLTVGETSNYNRSGARRIRAKIRSNWYNYHVYFRKWETDPWIQDY